MYKSIAKALVVFILTTSIVISSLFMAIATAQMEGNTKCEQCGMVVDSVSAGHLKVVDVNGTSHPVECIKCAFKLVHKYGELLITTTCDWNGPSIVIIINLKDNINATGINPQSTRFIDGTCRTSRIVSSQAALDALFANNGTSPYLAAIQNVTIAKNATVMTVAQAAALYAFSSYTPDPMQEPNEVIIPSNSSGTHSEAPGQSGSSSNDNQSSGQNPTSGSGTKTCEVCGMDVSSEAQVKYRIVDGNGTVHYAECYMCALHLLNEYDQVNITTSCDWYGSNYTVKVQSSQYGKTIMVDPSDAMFLNGESCAANRVAYNQTAADELMQNGYSQENTLSEQHYAMPSNTNVTSVKDAATTYAGTVSPSSSGQPPLLLIVAVVAGVALIVAGLVAYKKLKRP